MESIRRIRKIEPSAHSSVNIDELRAACYSAMNDDFNSPVLIAHLFEAVRIINSAIDKKRPLRQSILII